MNEGEGLSLEQICANGCKAYFQAHDDEGRAFFELLKPSDGDVYIRAHCFLSQVLSFRRRFDEALICMHHLLVLFPTHEYVLRHACLVHTYRGEYKRACQCHGAYEPKPDEKDAHFYQAACLLAARRAYEGSLLALDVSIQAGGAVFAPKFWYDPELVLLWEVLPAIADQPEIRKILLESYWPDILASYDPGAPFDRLDPGNLHWFSFEDMEFVSVRARGPYAFIVESRRSNDPQRYDALLQRLNNQRELSVFSLKLALQKVYAHNE